MGKSSKTAAPALTDDELRQRLLGALRERAASKAELGKPLPKWELPRALELARELARQGLRR